MKRRNDFAIETSSDEDEVMNTSTNPNESVDNYTTSSFFFSAKSPLSNCLVREVSQMPVTRQQKAKKDVLGIASSVEENLISPELIDQVFQAIEDIEEKQAWDFAVQLDRSYTTSPKRALSFLRSVGGTKPKQAAKRMVRHFATKLNLFGPSKLVQDIELSDLDEDDMEALESGGFQVLPQKDRAGRPILFGRYTQMKYREAKNMVRALWYIWNTMVEDEEHQISGIVAIGFENGKLPLERLEQEEASMFDMHAIDGGFDKDLAREILKIPLSVPIRPMGYHICADSSQWQSIFDMVMVTICKFVRIRLRFHYGTQQETMYAMMTHGIPVDALPFKGGDTSSVEIDLSHHFAWIENRRETERQRRLLPHDESIMMDI